MGMDVDAVFARTALENIQDIVGKLPHGKREEICDDIVGFQNMICKKYGYPSAFIEKEQSTEEELKKLEEEAKRFSEEELKKLEEEAKRFAEMLDEVNDYNKRLTDLKKKIKDEK